MAYGSYTAKFKNLDKIPKVLIKYLRKKQPGTFSPHNSNLLSLCSIRRQRNVFLFYLQCTLLVLAMNIWALVSLICRFRLCLERPVFSVILLLFKGHRILSKNLKRKCNQAYNLVLPSHLQMHLNALFSTFLKCCRPRLKMCFRFSKSKNLANVLF